MNLFVNFPVWGQSGWEVVCRGMLIALDKLGVNIQLQPKETWNSESCFISIEDTSRLQRMARTQVKVTDSYAFMQQFPVAEFVNSKACSLFKKTFCFSIFETSRCPVPWIPLLNRMTKTLTFSDFNKETYEKSGVKNVEVVPFGIDTKLFNPLVRPFREKKQDEFVFLTSGDFTERKNFEGLIEAYVKEFTNKDKVVLIIKMHYQGFVRRFQEECKRRIKEVVNRFNSIDPPKILFLGHKTPWITVPHFYTAGDCFVLVSRGEGIGLPYAEALACGVPCIATSFGGQGQFLNDKNSLFVNYEIRTIDDMEYIRKCLWALNHSWAFPEVNAIRSSLRFAYEFRDVMVEKGKQGRADMEKLTWQDSAISIVKKCLE